MTREPDLFAPDAGRPARDPLSAGEGAPLAARMRPRSIDEFLGQPDLVGEGAPLRELIKQDRVPSLILWGPPGCGKTRGCRRGSPGPPEGNTNYCVGPVQQTGAAGVQAPYDECASTR